MGAKAEAKWLGSPLDASNVYNAFMPGFSTIQSAVDSLARGEVIIVVDAEDRENEGDFICAAEKATPQTINFVLSGRGQFCTPLLPDVARRLQLVPVVETNTTP